MATYRTANNTYAIQQLYYGSTGAILNAAGFVDYGATEKPGEAAKPICIQQLGLINAWSMPAIATLSPTPAPAPWVVNQTALTRANSW